MTDHTHVLSVIALDQFGTFGENIYRVWTQLVGIECEHNLIGNLGHFPHGRLFHAKILSAVAGIYIQTASSQ